MNDRASSALADVGSAGEPKQTAPQTKFWALTLGSIGVVYGDIGTSPLYAIREAVTAAVGANNPASEAAVLGILSLVIWALLIVVTAKYVVILLRADNHGEGGTLALMAMAYHGLGQNAPIVVLLGIVSAALFYGDAMITPALSVLSAVEGLKIVTPAFEAYVVPLAALILVALFAAQSYGTAKVAALFGPITLVWFVALAAAGVWHTAQNPDVLAAFNPMHGIDFLIAHRLIGFLTLGAVFLAVTGAEALYADLGHFGRRPIQAAWLFIVLPALTINYLGQGALVLAQPKTIENPFFLMYPEWALLPMVALATAATVIASQAVITGAYSITRQAVQLGLLPRLEIRHTSADLAGQIFMPRVNLLLLLGVLLLVLMFRSSSALASAYGIAVTGTMVVTSALAFIVIWKVWRWPAVAAAFVIGPFMLIDLTFLTANMLKVLDGGWMPLALGAAIMLVMYTWRRGSGILSEKTRRTELPLDELIERLERKPPPAGARNRGFSHRQSAERADRATPQPQALQGAARAQRSPHHRDRSGAAGRSGGAREHPADFGNLRAYHHQIRLHGNAERAAGACGRTRTRLAFRDHVDVVLPVAPHVAARRNLAHAALAGPLLHRACAHRKRRHRLFPGADRARGRGGNTSKNLNRINMWRCPLWAQSGHRGLSA